MDGIFVKNKQFSIKEIQELAKYSKKPFDIHFMVEDPLKYIGNLHIKNIITITVHIEINKDINKIIKTIKSLGYEVGLAIKPQTNIEELNKYINTIDKILVMSVEPGFGGQKFIENTIDRILKIKNKKADILIEVDGGINDETIQKIKYISDVAVVGSYITNNDNYQNAINNLKK